VDEQSISRGHTKRFLLESEEDGVNELDVFKEIVDHIVEFKSLLMVAWRGDATKESQNRLISIKTLNSN